MGFRLVGPTHPDALDVYTFTMGDVRRQDDRLVYNIYFAPKRALATTFVGYLAVLDEAYVVLEVGLRPHPDNVWPPPVLSADVHFEQHFAAFGESVWLPVDLRVHGNVSFGRLGVSYPTARYEQVSRLTNHVINVLVPDSLYAGSQRLFKQPFADTQDYLFRWNPGLVPLTPKEIEAVITLDPSMTIRRAFRPDGFLRQYTALEVTEEAPVEEAGSRSRLQQAAALLGTAAVSYNRVDGWHLGLRPVFQLGPSLGVKLRGGYDTDRKRLFHGADLTYAWGNADPSAPGRGVFLGGGYDEGTRSRYESSVYGDFLTGVATYFGYDDYYDYYHNRRFFVQAGGRSAALRTGLTVGLTVERHRSATRNADYEGWLFGETQRENPAITEGNLRALTLRLNAGAAPSATTPGVSLVVDIEHSPPGMLGSAFDYSTLRGAVTGRFPTLFRRRPWPNTLTVRAVGGTFRGKLPLQRFGILDTALGPYGPFGAFRARSGTPYEGERYLGLFWEYDFSTVPFELLGLWGLAERGLGVSIFGAHGRTWIDGDRRLPFEPVVPDALHHEIGFALTHPFHLPLRFDVTTRLDQPGVFMGLGLFSVR